MPAPVAENVNFLHRSLAARYPGRAALTTQEVADWMAETWGVANSVEMCRRRLARIRSSGSRPVIKRRNHGILDLSYDLAEFLHKGLPSTTRPASPSFSPHKGKDWSKDFKFGKGGAKTVGFASSEGWELVESCEDEPAGFDILQGIDSAVFRRRVEGARDAAESFWDEVQRLVIATDRARALENAIG